MAVPSTTGFQQSVALQPAPAQAGDFASANPRASLLGGPGEWVAPNTGLVVGRFCWAIDATRAVTQGYSAGAAVGFLHRELNALITTFMAPSGNVTMPGGPVTLHSQGEFWALFAAGATPGQKVFADDVTGAPIAGTAGVVTGGQHEVPWYVNSPAAAGELAKISTWG